MRTEVFVCRKKEDSSKSLKRKSAEEESLQRLAITRDLIDTIGSRLDPDKRCPAQEWSLLLR